MRRLSGRSLPPAAPRASEAGLEIHDEEPEMVEAIREEDRASDE
jgi:hypothetical protein